MADNDDLDDLLDELDSQGTSRHLSKYCRSEPRAGDTTSR